MNILATRAFDDDDDVDDDDVNFRDRCVYINKVFFMNSRMNVRWHVSRMKPKGFINVSRTIVLLRKCFLLFNQK